MRGNRTLDQFEALGVYDDREIKHMVDVRELIDKVRLVHIITGFIILVSLLLLAKDSTGRPAAARALQVGGATTIALFLLVVFLRLDFSTSFLSCFTECSFKEKPGSSTQRTV